MAGRIAAALKPVPLIDITDLTSRRGPAQQPCAGEDALAVIQYTSGSTSSPKGVALSQRNVVAGLPAVTAWMNWTAEDAFGVWIPLFHDMGLFTTLSSLARGSSACLWQPSEFIRQPMRWLESFAQSVATVTAAPNFSFDFLVAAALKDPPRDLDLSRWRIACNGAEPVLERTMKDFEKAFAPYGLRSDVMKPVYGMAEATLGVSGPVWPSRWQTMSVDRARLRLGDQIRAGDRAVASCGSPVPELDVRVADESGLSYPDGTVGEVQLRGASVTAGYLEATAGAQPFTADGWLHTGDLAFTRDNEIYLVGRLKDMITVRGQNFYAEDVEEIVRSTPGMNRPRIAAVAFQDREGEKMAVLWETTLTGAAAEPLAMAASLRVTQSFGLEGVQVVAVAPASIPHTTSGKVRRQAACQLFEASRHLAIVTGALAAEASTDPGKIHAPQELAAIPGLDSVKILRAVVRIEEDSGISIPDDFLFETATVQDLANLVTRLTGGGR
jgi:acyl-CoA synthetase (AMP-forming)/AMP-acid ligase II/acyl carrier protein